MRKKVRIFTAALMCVLIALTATSLVAFAESAEENPSETVLCWTAESNNSASSTSHDDGSLTVSTIGKNNPFNQSAYLYPSECALNGYDDIAVSFNLKVSAETGGDQPLTFNYGIKSAGQFNMTFYWQSGKWTNAVCGGQNFSGTTATMKLYAGADHVLTEIGPNTAFGFDTFIANFAACEWAALANENGHDFTIRATKKADGVLIRIYYDSTTCNDDKLVYSLDLAASTADNIEDSFLGVNIYESEYTLSAANVCSLVSDPVGPNPGPVEPDPIDPATWNGINASESTVFDFDAWETDRTIKINDIDATTEAFFRPQAVAKLSYLYGNDVSVENDYAVSATVKIDSIGNKYSPETQVYFYWYIDGGNYYGTGFQYYNLWNNAFVYATNGGAGYNTIAKNGNGQYAGGLSTNIVNTALPMSGLLSGTAGRERTFVSVFSVIENKGVYARIYLKGNNEIDLENDVPIYQSMIYTNDISDLTAEKAYFGVRIFNADATVSNISVSAVAKNNEGLVAGASVTGDMGIWNVNDSLPAAVYTAQDGVITMDDTLSSATSHGISGITATLDDLAGDKEYLGEKDFVIGFNLKFLPVERETVLWFSILDENNNYISIGMFRQYVSSEYRWTNSCVLSNSGNPISGYVYEKFGKTTGEFENVSYNFCGIMAVPSVAAFNAWDSAAGHGFYVRYTVEGARLVIRLYYDYGNGINFYTDEEVYKVVIYDYPHTDLQNVRFGLRALGAQSTLSDVSFENFSTLYAQGELDAPNTGDDDNNNDNDGNQDVSGKNKGKTNKAAIAIGCSVAGVAVIAGVVVAIILIRKKKRRGGE